MLKILIADDHRIVREGIINSLNEHYPNSKIKEAENAAAALELARGENWNLIILDINMPGRSGLEVLKEIKEFDPPTPVIILSMYPEDQFAVRVLKVGASAYLHKDTSTKELITAINRALHGEHYITPSIAELLTDEVQISSAKQNHKTLSDREYQVFISIASGKSVSGIAEDLSLSVKTISVYRANILQKMNLKNNSEITHYAFKNNLVDIV